MKRRHRHWLLREFDDGSFWGDDGDSDGPEAILAVLLLHKSIDATYYGLEIHIPPYREGEKEYDVFPIGAIVHQPDKMYTVSVEGSEYRKPELFQEKTLKAAVNRVQKALQKTHRGMKFPIKFIRRN